MPGIDSSKFRLPMSVLPFVIVVVALLIGGGWLLTSKQQSIDQLTAQWNRARQDLAERNAKIQELEEQLSASQKEVSSRDDRLASLRTQLDSASKDIEHSREILRDMEQRYEGVAKDREQLQNQLASTTAERDAFSQKAESAERAGKELEKTAARLRERLALLDRDYRKLSAELDDTRSTPAPMLSVVGAAGPVGNQMVDSTAPSPPMVGQGIVELPPIIVQRGQAGTTLPVRGRVSDVNEEHGFIVIDKGSLAGINTGMVFNILRGGSTVGRAVVVRVRPQIAACDIVRAKTPGPVQPGDVAVQSGP